MSRRYDSRTTIFSPEGRLYQVEYAMEAINHAGAAIGIVTPEGVVLATEKKVTSKLLDQTNSQEKIYRVDERVAVAVAGFTADANTLVTTLQSLAQQHYLDYGENVPVEVLVSTLASHKQAYTQYGGLRPFGVSILYAGWDESRGFQLYLTDPSGNYGGWQATAIGGNASNAKALLKTDYRPDMTLAEAISLVIKIVGKTADNSAMSADRLEFATVTRSKRTGDVVFRAYTAPEVNALLKKEGVLSELAEDEDPAGL
ncbi:hypothetical protein CXG81DRAFT_11757 [Caulochytrium protostelioides]|uniref:Proteasome subunit alpha type n=1 Tax=Caulochytrium protostelioides TaxID=1555241 RepID=A0A4P9X8K2_9FUNG|nr:N-terminal nucleophile aminohydrolase [Caulochytrium protostelioides]RKP01606.1 hypothetical protein CXG81DRAFT_11757 [Caulochytrium protostelioides]|eukprot:RKP01606.1 hypothetical protein CXG81DRAFT_11757 [Caulochytrium protostelioides]